MLRSMYSGVSGMKGLQVKMDVIANNIANVNTTAFKSSRVNFQDIMSQTTANATAAGGRLGGQNAQQVGLGVQVGAIDTVHTVGAPQGTGRALDFYIQGNGYFVVQNSDGSDLYTRDGTFTRDANGNITNSAGMKVQGIAGDLANPIPYDPDTFDIKGTTPDAAGAAQPNPESKFDFDRTDFTDDMGGLEVPPKITIQVEDPNDPTKTIPKDVEFQSFEIDGNGFVFAKYGDKEYVMGRVAVANFTNPDGLQKTGGNNYETSANSGGAIVGAAGTNGTGMLLSGSLEMSNVDLSMEFTEMIVASRAYQANSRSITTSDEMLQELINLKR